MNTEKARAAGDWRTAPDVASRVECLITEMNLGEKVALVTGDLNHQYGFYNAPIERLGIPALTMADGPPGVRINNGAVHEGKSTALPAPIALAASWNPDLARRYGHVLASETRASGHNVFLGPAVDIARVPVGGRTFESFGEDPLLNARLAAAEVEAIQSHALLACLKHYAVNNQEFERSSVNVEVDERTLHELYLRPFEMVVRGGGVATLMGAFNRINGSFACEHRPLLTQVLRETWGFQGWVMSDYGATHSTTGSALAGLDQEQPSAAFYGDKLERAVTAGEVPLAVLDEMCRRILRTMVGLGLMEQPPAVGSMGDMAREAHRQVAREVAEQGAVLLKNDGALLPLEAARLRRVAVIGVDADSVSAAGGGSGKIKSAHAVSLLQGIRERLGNSATVGYAQGCDPISAADLLPGEPSIPSCFLRTETDGSPGVRAELWNNTDWRGEPFAVKVLPQLALNLGFFNFPGFGAASARYPQFPFELTGRTSARFTARLQVPTAGLYRLSVALLGSVRVWLDDELVLDFRYHGPGRTGGADAASGLALLAGGTAGTTSANSVADRGVPLQGPAQALLSLHANELPQGTPATTAPTGSGGAGPTGPAPDLTWLPLQLGHRAGGHRLRVDYAADAPTQGHLTGAQIRLGWQAPAGVVSEHIREAAELARGADVAIVAVRAYESEHMDRPGTELPNGQAELIRAVAAANPNTVVISMSGGAIETRSWAGTVPAILHAWYAGQEQGSALARLLFGDVNPSAKLPLSFAHDDASGLPRTRRQYPGVGGTVSYDEGLEVGYRGFDARGIEPAFAFGHGLSYTHFGYSGLELTVVGGRIHAACTVRNEGARAGVEVVQLYLGLPLADQPPKRLVDWARVPLEPGQAERVSFTLDAGSLERPLGVWQAGHGWINSSGTVQVYVGASSRDIRLQGEVVV